MPRGETPLLEIATGELQFSLTIYVPSIDSKGKSILSAADFFASAAHDSPLILPFNTSNYRIVPTYFSLTSTMLFRSALVALYAAALTSASDLRGTKADPGRDLSSCTGCYPGTSGVCISTDKVCWDLLYGSCPSGTKLCGATPPGATSPCTNSVDNGNATNPDNGCVANKPVCVGDDNAPGGAQLASDLPGIACAKCLNSLESNAACDPDDGCPLEQRICKKDGYNIPIWFSGNQCVVECKNTDPGDGNDDGCYGHLDAYKLCVKNDYSEPAHNAKGSRCVPCVNDVYNGKDRGCAAGLSCKKNDGSEPLIGKAGETCVPRCFNTADYPYVDSGCTVGEEICVDALGEQPPDNGAGVDCVPCTDITKEVSVCFAVDASGSIGTSNFNTYVIP
jgi:hypothetical protein